MASYREIRNMTLSTQDVDMLTAQDADARMLAEFYGFDADVLRYQVDRRSFGSFTTTLAGSPRERDRHQRALAYVLKHRSN